MLTASERIKNEVEALRKLLDNFGTTLRVADVGIIKSFDAEKQTVVVELAITEKINNGEGFDDIQIPILVDVPVVIPRAGGFALTLPITVGDECLVVFSDKCIDAWYQSGGVQNQMFKRRHDLSDGFAIIGIGSQPKVITDYSTDSAQLRNSSGSVMVEVKDDVVNIGGGTFRNLIDDRIVTWLNALTLPVSGAIAGPVTTPLVLENVATSKTKAG